MPLRVSLLLSCFMTLSIATLAANPVPFVNQPLVPTSAAPGSSAFTLVVNGTGFVSGAVVDWNGSARATTFVSSSQLKASILPSDVASAGTASVSVVNPVPGGGRSNIGFFPITNPATTISFSRKAAAHGQLLGTPVAADFNGDGKIDLAVTVGYSDLVTPQPSVGVLMGNGDGTFQKPVNYRTASQPWGLVSADFNGDGIPDLAVGAGFPTHDAFISILIGNGDGTFQHHIDYTSGDVALGQTPIVAADFNSDGKLDLAVFSNSGIGVFLGNGDGTFAPPVFATFNTTQAILMAVGDFNGDNKLDMAVALNQSVVILTGNGDGTFQVSSPINLTHQSQGVSVADLNGDGKLDLAIGGGGNDTILLGKGDGTFQSGIVIPDDNGGVRSIATSDLNGDGKPDLVVSHDDIFVTYLLGNGDGTFQPFVDLQLDVPGPLALGDFNGDGKLDIGVASYQTTPGLFEFLQH